MRTPEPLRHAFCPESHDRLLGDALDMLGGLPSDYLPAPDRVLAAFTDRVAQTAQDYPENRATFDLAHNVMLQTGHTLVHRSEIADDTAALMAACAAAAPFYRTPLPTDPGRQWSVGADMTISLLRAVEESSGFQLVTDDDPLDEDRRDLPGPVLALLNAS